MAKRITSSRGTESGPRNYSEIAFEYAREAVKDKKGRKFCEYVRLAAKRHLNDLKRQTKDKRWPYRFDEWHGNDVCDFIEKLPHIEGEWETPTITLEPAQIFVLVVVFGWRRKSDGNRRFNTVYFEVARKNAKSALSAGVALYCLTCEGENGPQVKCAATTGDQARIVFDVAKKMVDKTADLREAFSVETFANAIACWANGGDVKPINSKASTQDGLNPHCSIIDELHAHKDRGLFDVLKSARGARKNPLSWYITTAGYNTQGVCYEQRKFVVKILEGVIEADHYFGIIFTLDKGDNEFDERLWIKANPLLGVSVQLEEFRGYAKEAQLSPQSLSEYKTKRLNIWTGAKSAWINTELWKRCDGPVELALLEPERCWAGLDLGSTSDITAFCLVWRVDGRVKVWCRFYVPEDAVKERTEKGDFPYQVWADQGYLTVTPGNVTDYTYVEKDVRECLDRFQVQEIAYDKWNATDLVNRLMEAEAPMVEFRQGTQSFNAPMKELERAIKAGTLDHGGNPVLNWMASNIVARKDVNENLAPDKKNSEEKIDGIVAILQGLGRAMTGEEDSMGYVTDRIVFL